MKDALLRAVGKALDGLEVGFCAFDSEDRTLAWNATFLAFFPEHDGFVHEGEHYSANLRRFYQIRLDKEEMLYIDRYIAEGVARHRIQRRPYEFDHRNFRVRVASFDMGPFGRVRVWRKVGLYQAPVERPVSSSRALATLNTAVILERLADGVLIVDVADKAMWANQAFLDLYGLKTLDAALGESFEHIYRMVWASDETDEGFASGIVTLAENQRYSGAPFELALPNQRWVRVIEQRGEADGRGYFVHVDITSLKRQQAALVDAEERYRLLAEHLQELSTTDALTGLANRRKLDEALALEFRRAQREGHPLSVLAIDIDHFKDINDHHGHQVGDAVLRALGAVFASFAQRAGDLAVRFGGEEFVLLLPVTDQVFAVTLAEKILAAVATTVFEPTAVGPVTASIGVATFATPDDHETAERLIARADAALYAAKRAGRNRVVVAGFEPPHLPAADSAQQVIKKALEG